MKVVDCKPAHDDVVRFLFMLVKGRLRWKGTFQIRCNLDKFFDSVGLVIGLANLCMIFVLDLVVPNLLWQVYGPVANNNYESLSFPGILDAIYEASSKDTRQNWAAVQHEIFRATRVISRAALVLRGKLT